MTKPAPLTEEESPLIKELLASNKLRFWISIAMTILAFALGWSIRDRYGANSGSNSSSHTTAK